MDWHRPKEMKNRTKSVFCATHSWKILSVARSLAESQCPVPLNGCDSALHGSCAPLSPWQRSSLRTPSLEAKRPQEHSAWHHVVLCHFHPIRRDTWGQTVRPCLRWWSSRSVPEWGNPRWKAAKIGQTLLGRIPHASDPGSIPGCNTRRTGGPLPHPCS